MSDVVMPSAALRAERGPLVGPLIALAFGLAPLASWLLTARDYGALATQPLFWVKVYAAPTLAVELIVIVAAAMLAPRVEIGIARPLRITILAMGVLAFASILWAPAPAFALVRTFIWLIHFLFAAALARLCMAGVVKVEIMLASMAVGLCLVAALTMSFVALHDDAARMDWINGLPAFDNVRRIGYYAAPIGAVAAGQIASTVNRRDRACWSFVLIVAVTFTAWSGSRGGLVALAACILVGAVFFPAMRHRTALLLIGGSAGLGTLLAKSLPSGAGPMGIERMLDSGASSTGRTTLWVDTLEVALRRPILGFGESQVYFTVPIAKVSSILHPHNLPLQAFHASGIVGVTLLAVSATLLVRRLWPARRTADNSIVPLALGIVALLVFSLYDGTLYHVQASATFFALVGMMLAAKPERTT